MVDRAKISVRLSPEIQALLSDRIRQTGTHVSDILREALEAYLGIRPTQGPTELAAAVGVTQGLSDILARLAALASDVSDTLTRVGALEHRVATLEARPTVRPAQRPPARPTAHDARAPTDANTAPRQGRGRQKTREREG